MSNDHGIGPVVVDGRTVGHVRRYGDGFEGIIGGLLSGRVVARDLDADAVRKAVDKAVRP